MGRGRSGLLTQSLKIVKHLERFANKNTEIVVNKECIEKDGISRYDHFANYVPRNTIAEGMLFAAKRLTPQQLAALVTN